MKYSNNTRRRPIKNQDIVDDDASPVTVVGRLPFSSVAAATPILAQQHDDSTLQDDGTKASSKFNLALGVTHYYCPITTLNLLPTLPSWVVRKLPFLQTEYS